jgi:hypothetical protein
MHDPWLAVAAETYSEGSRQSGNNIEELSEKRSVQARALFVWLTSHQPAVFFSPNKSAISNQLTVLFSQNKPAPAISHQPTEQAADGLFSSCQA